MVKLVEELGTKYFHFDWENEVRRVLNEHKEDGVDIADARLVQNINHVVFNYVRSGYNIVDTLDPERERFLRMNAERGRLAAETESWPLLSPPPVIKKIAGGMLMPDVPIEERIAGLPQGACYQYKSAQQSAMYYVILVTAARPDITIRYGAYTREVFLFIRDNMRMNLLPHMPLLLLDKSGNFYEVEPPADGFRDFVMDNICIPAEFGKVNLFQGEPAERWMLVLDNAYNYLYKMLHPQTPHITDFL